MRNFDFRTTFWIIALGVALFSGTCFSQETGKQGGPPANVAARVAQDIKPAIIAMIGDESVVDDFLLRSIVGTSLTYRQGTTVIMYSPIHAVVIFMHIDGEGKLFTYAFGVGELYEIGGSKYGHTASYLMLRYEYIPILIHNIIENMKKDPNYIINVIYPASQKTRDHEENKLDVLLPAARMTQPENMACIHSLDRARLIALLKTHLPDQKYLEWFDHMFAADILPDSKGNTTIIFVNDLTRRLHLFVPVTTKDGKCVPGVPSVTFIR